MRVPWWAYLFLFELPSPYCSTCSCSCCRFEILNQGDASTHCVLVAKDQMFMSPYRTQQESCPDLCDRNTTDKVITDVNGTQIDYQRFCYDECSPGSNVTGSTCVERASAGKKHVALPVIHHHRHHHHKSHHTAQIARGSHFQRVVNVKKATEMEPWPSMKDEYTMIGMRSEQEWRQAAKKFGRCQQSCS